MACIGIHKHLNLNKVHCFQCVCAYIPKQQVLLQTIHTSILAIGTSILVLMSDILVLVPTPIYHY